LNASANHKVHAVSGRGAPPVACWKNPEGMVEHSARLGPQRDRSDNMLSRVLYRLLDLYHLQVLL
jgi:hypothetical protein